MASGAPTLRVVRHQRLHAAAPPPGTTHTPLSILDNSVACYAPTSAVWFFPAPHDAEAAYEPQHLLSSLRAALSAFPHLCGQLSFIPQRLADAANKHYHRGYRLQISYGEDIDQPGVEVVFAECQGVLQHAAGWRTEVLQLPLLPEEPPLALTNMMQQKAQCNSPVLILQLTTFGCGSLAVAAKLHHSLGDIQTLTFFMQCWSSIHRDSSAPPPKYVFDPALLDVAAAKVTDDEHVDVKLLQQVTALPLHRFDYYAPTATPAPAWARVLCTPPVEVQVLSPLQYGRALPWAEWDISAPVRHQLFRFTASDIQTMHAAHQTTAETRLDVLQARIWHAIIQARIETAPESQHTGSFYLDVSIGLRHRSRLSPPLPQTFCGSPLVNAFAECTATAAEPLLGLHCATLSTSIRHARQHFDSAANNAAVLHVFSHDTTPVRHWGCFLGHRHTIVTSWLGAGVHNVQFIKGQSPLHVAPLIPPCDGVVVLVEAPGRDSRSQSSRSHWSDSDVYASIHLRADVMDALLQQGSITAAA